MKWDVVERDFVPIGRDRLKKDGGEGPPARVRVRAADAIDAGLGGCRQIGPPGGGTPKDDPDDRSRTDR
jgi:hypothetical protein